MKNLVTMAKSQFDAQFFPDVRRALRGALAVFICSSLLAMLAVTIMIAVNARTQ